MLENQAKGQYKDASNLNARIRLHELFSKNNEGFHEWVFDQMNLKPSLKILECGCGPGALWYKNKNKIPDGCEITLVDMSEGMLDESRKNIGITNNKFNFVVGDIQELSFENESFDVVIANHMLYHVPDIIKGLNEAKRVLKNNGMFFASTFGKLHLKELDELTRKFVELPTQRTSDRFCLENGYQMIVDVFGKTVLLKHDDALDVKAASPLIDYILSGSKAREQLKGEKLNSFIEHVNSIFKDNKRFYIQKDAGVFKCKKLSYKE